MKDYETMVKDALTAVKEVTAVKVDGNATTKGEAFLLILEDMLWDANQDREKEPWKE